MLKTRQELILELEEIREKFIMGEMNQDDAKFRLTITRQAIQVHALEILSKRFCEGLLDMQSGAGSSVGYKILPKAQTH